MMSLATAPDVLPEVVRYSVRDVLRPYGWIFVVSFLVTVLATPALRAVAMRLRIVDKPDAFLKPHTRPIAYLGGVGIYLGWLAGMLMLMASSDWPSVWPWVMGFTIGGGVAMLVGLIDDLRSIRPRTKLLGQLLAGVILLGFGVGLYFINTFLSYPLGRMGMELPNVVAVAISVPVVLFLILAATNATNLLDGLDGLCSGVTGIIAVCFFILATHLATYGHSPGHDEVRIVASLAMFGAVCGFLPYNSNPATIFMGDAGSLLLGFYAATMMVMFGERDIARWLLGAVMIFGLPILDTSLALIRRVRLNRPIFTGDRSHLYDQLVDRGFSVRQTVIICYVLAGLYGLIGLGGSILLRTRYAIFLYLAAVAVTALLCWKWGFLTPSPKDEPRTIEQERPSSPERP